MLVRGGRLIDPIAGIDALRDVRLSDVVTEVGEHLEARAGEEIVDASGAIVAPGFIDMHVHLREPGNPEKETIETGTEAAVRGGFTAVACMPNTSPATDDLESLRALLQETLARARCSVYPIAAITQGRRGALPCAYAPLAAAGAVAFSDDGDGIADARVLFDAATDARFVEAPFISHCEDATLKVVDESLAEAAAVARDILVAGATKKRWHLAHLSTRAGVELLRFARAQGVAVTAEAAPHHLLCTQAQARAMGAAGSVNPPLRAEDDARALRDGVRDGTIDVLASDHAPHTAEQKSAGAPGFSGLEVAVGAYASALPDVSLSRFVALLSAHPARVLGIPGGTLQRGARADVTILRDAPWRVDAASFASKGKSTPFDGMALSRRAIATIVGGRMAYRA